MKPLIYALSALAVAGLAPHSVQAADLGGYDESYEDRGPVVEGPPVVRRSYDYYYDEGPVVSYYAPRFYRPYPYYAGYYPYRYGYWGGPRWGGPRWGGRGYWGRPGHWGGHRGWR
ncbi:MAG: hypothetical protein QM780_08855 [Hyphomicrobium sp.]|uniref:hypothetical protein n=1 Tax=Hyphomicrobium sp. TaxID=82 RepID=UPI0039E257D1